MKSEMQELASGVLGLEGGWGHLVLRLLDTQVLLGAMEDMRTEWSEGLPARCSWGCGEEVAMAHPERGESLTWWLQVSLSLAWWWSWLGMQRGLLREIRQQLYR